MRPGETPSPHFQDELDPTVRTALNVMLSQCPDADQIETTMERLRRSGAPPQSSKRLVASRGLRRLASSAAASLVLCLLWFGAQTETWGRVTQDFQRTALSEATSVVSETTDNHVRDREPSGSRWLRFILILHVFALLAGLAGMFVSWLGSLWYWFTATWLRFTAGRAGGAWCRHVHLYALLAYGCGLLFGCMWALFAWGALWSWDPRETFSLITLGVGTLWYICNRAGEVEDPRERAIREPLVASLAFWMIALLYIPGAIDAPGPHAYGFATPLPTIVACLWGFNLLMLLATYAWQKWRDSTPQRTNGTSS